MSVLASYIRSRIAGQTIDNDAETNIVHLVMDSLPPGGGVAAVDLAIEKAREGYCVLFKPTPKPVDTRSRVLSTVGGVYNLRKKPA